MATYLVLYPKPFMPFMVDGETRDAKYFHIDPGMETEQVARIVEEAAWDEQIVLKVVLVDLPFPVPMGFRKCDWSAWMVHPLSDHEGDVALGPATEREN